MAINFGELADALYAKNEEISQANAVVKDLETEKREIENTLLLAMQDAGTNIVRGSSATVSISENVRPQIQDFDAFTKFVLRRKALHLFERRIASTAYRELKDELGGKPVPGLSEFTQVRLNVRKV
jgi:hypothetical protein